jgi:hypothetical protein
MYKPGSKQIPIVVNVYRNIEMCFQQGAKRYASVKCFEVRQIFNNSKFIICRAGKREADSIKISNLLCQLLKALNDLG